MKYRIHFVNLENGYTTICIYLTIEEAINAVKDIMFTASEKYRITITTKENK